MALDLYVTSMRFRCALPLQHFCRMRRKLIDEKKLRHEKVVMGSGGISDVGMPSSSTSGGKEAPAGALGVKGLFVGTPEDWDASITKDGDAMGGSSRRRLITGGGAAPSDEESERSWGGSSESSSRPTRE